MEAAKTSIERATGFGRRPALLITLPFQSEKARWIHHSPVRTRSMVSPSGALLKVVDIKRRLLEAAAVAGSLFGEFASNGAGQFRRRKPLSSNNNNLISSRPRRRLSLLAQQRPLTLARLAGELFDLSELAALLWLASSSFAPGPPPS